MVQSAAGLKKRRAFKRYFLAVGTALLSGLALAGLPQAVAPVSSAAPGDFPLTFYKLKNGLTVILSEDNTLPLVSVVVAYGAGSIHEQPGKTGLATLMENLMFSGSLDVPPLQHINFINRVGGTLSAAAAEDKTIFYQTLPSYQLALALWLESDRMRFLDIDEARVAKARSELFTDIRERQVNEPYWKSLSLFDPLIYSGFPFNHTLSGAEEDISGLTLDDVKAFYATYYAPNNAVLCITGDFNKIKARELVSRYFDTLPRGKDITPAFELPPGPNRKPAISTVVDPIAPSPAFTMGFRLSAPQSPEFYTLVVLDYVLLRGRTSRLIRRLLNPDKKIAFRVAGGIEQRLDRAVYKISVIATPTMIEPCQTAIFDELARIKQNFLSAAELDRFKAILKQDYYRRISNSLDRALLLVNNWFSLRDFSTASSELRRYLAVTPIDIVGIASRYFTPANSVILNVRMN